MSWDPSLRYYLGPIEDNLNVLKTFAINHKKNIFVDIDLS